MLVTILMMLLFFSVVRAGIRLAWGVMKFVFGLGLFWLCPLLFVLAVLFGGFSHMWLPILIIGLLYVIEALSVIMQVGYFKLTHGKRIFRMAPIHHHFEKGGMKETQVVKMFWAFTAVCCLAGLLVLH